MAVPRIPFTYTLIDKRHKGFAEGKRNGLLTFAHVIFSPTFIFALFFGGLGVVFFLWPGLRGLVRDYSLRNNNGVFHEGQGVPIRYLRTDPTENVYALDPMPKSVLYWVLAGLGAFWVYVAATPIYRHLTQYRAVRKISRQGQIVQGYITSVHRPPAHSSSLDVKLDYVFTSPAGVRCQAREAISLFHLAGDPKPGTAVAVWWTQEGNIMLI